MKAAELNGTHIGKSISITLAEASITDVLAEISHSADLIDHRTMASAAENWVQGRRHTHLRFMRLGSITVDPDAIIVLGGQA